MNTQEKEQARIKIIMNALNDGWAVKRSLTNSRTFEFTKNQSLDPDFKGLILFNINTYEDVQRQLDILQTVKKDKLVKSRRSISTPVVKNIF